MKQEPTVGGHVVWICLQSLMYFCGKQFLPSLEEIDHGQDRVRTSTARIVHQRLADLLLCLIEQACVVGGTLESMTT
jgi:hypothetical protein